jgi:aerobic-type carbon monoxide dehydrogenase small subunit (CoxS/CutS family)
MKDKNKMSESPENFEIEFNGMKIKARKDQTIAAVLVENGIKTFRKTKKNASRGPFCGIGLCCECRTTVDGVSDVRTCITPARPGCKVMIQNDSLLERKER